MMPLLNTLTFLRCPICNQSLSVKESILTCGDHIFERKNGVWRFTSSDYYYGEIPKAEMTSIIESTRKTDAHAALTNYLNKDKKGQGLYRYIFNPGRASWLWMTSMKKKKRVLDIGCGWGSVLFPLAEFFEEAVGIELTIERLEMAAALAKEKKLDNVSFIHGGEGSRLPFEDGSFDLVILNGVLEWVPESIPVGSPWDVQKAYLKEVHRILAPDGEVYIGIENRTAYTYFLGFPEDHTGLRFASLLPRPIANLYSKIKRHKPFRTYTYTREGYKKLVSGSGFESAKIYPVIPDYRLPSIYIYGPTRDSLPLIEDVYYGGKSLTHRLKRFLLKNMLHTGLIHSFSHSYSIVGRKTGSQPSHLEEILVKHNHTMREISYGFLTGGGENLIIGIKNKLENYILKIPVLKQIMKNVISHVENIEKARTIIVAKQPQLADLLPAGKLFFQNDYPYLYSKFIPGETFRTLEGKPELQKLCKEFIEQFHSCNKVSLKISDPDIYNSFFKPIEKVSAQFEQAIEIPFTTVLQLLHHLIAKYPEVKIDVGICHGDYHAGNIIFNGPQIKCVLDWDLFSEKEIQMLDWYHFLVKDKARSAGIATIKVMEEMSMDADDETSLFLVTAYLARLMHLNFSILPIPFLSNEDKISWSKTIEILQKKINSL